jgi:protein subunit release factor A
MQKMKLKVLQLFNVVLIVIFMFSCKTEKEINRPVTNEKEKTELNRESKVNTDKEDKSSSITDDFAIKQKVNRLAEEMANLKCSLKGLNIALENTIDANQKGKIKSKIKQLQKDIEELNKEIKDTFSDPMFIEETNNIALYLLNECQE